MARDMYLVGVSEDDLKPDPKPEGPKTPKGKWENFWYHYKWHTIGVIAVVAILAVLIGQMVTRDDPDYTLVLVTENGVPEACLDRLAAELEVAGRDLDGDGKIEVNIESLSMKGGGQMAMVGPQKLQVHMGAGDVLLFAFEPAYYEQYIQNNEDGAYRFFAEIGLDTDGILEDGRVWNWKDDVRRKDDPYLQTFPENLYFGVRDASGTAKKKGEMKDDCLNLLRAFITDTPQAPAESSQP